MLFKKRIENPEGKGLGDAAMEAAKEKLRKLGRRGPYYKRNAAKICTFWVKGLCKRGEECPYRHEKPTDPDNPLAKQNRRDRYFGTEDPVADKLWKRIEKMPDSIKPPGDRTITTLFLKGVTDSVSETDLNAYFYQFGPIQNITTIGQKNIGFIQYQNRADAERAMTNIHGQTILVGGADLSVRWGKAKEKKEDKKPDEYDDVPGLPGTLPAVGKDTDLTKITAAPGVEKRKYAEIAPPQELMVGKLVDEPVDLNKRSKKAKKMNRPKIGGRLEAVSSGSVHYPSQNPDHMGGYM